MPAPEHHRDEVRDFLTSRRERLSPEQPGIPFYGGRRRVKGLRREEVSMLAGMSTDYYTRLERGNLTGASEEVLESLSRALQLDEAERAHLFDLARYLFLDDRSRDFYADWATVARDCVASLRGEAGRNPYDRGVTDLVGELSTRSAEFRVWWAAHDVKLHRTATRTFRHPVAGEFELTGEALELPGDAGLTLIGYTVEPSSPAEQALGFLASWGAEPGVRTGTREAEPLDPPRA